MTSRDYYTNYPRSILWLIRGGTFVGGDEHLSPSRLEVDVAPFYISKTPISNLQYEAYDTSYGRARNSRGDRDPAVNISYDDALGYIAWYSKIARKPFRLPTEIEWEYACRAGSQGHLFFENPADADAYMWHRGNSGACIGDLEEKKANPWGLWGCLGGVWEWTSSIYEAGNDSSGYVLRGGSYRLDAKEITCSLRLSEAAATRREDVGFRIARNLR